MIQKHKIIKFGYFMMRQDNLLEELFIYVVITGQRRSTCLFFNKQVLALPNQTKVNSAEPKLQVLISSYIHMYINISSIFVIKNIGKQFTVRLQRFHHVCRACRSAGKNWALSSDNYWALFWLSAVIPTVQTRLSGTRSSIHVGKTDRILRSQRFLTSEVVVLVRATESAQPINTWD